MQAALTGFAGFAREETGGGGGDLKHSYLGSLFMVILYNLKVTKITRNYSLVQALPSNEVSPNNSTSFQPDAAS